MSEKVVLTVEDVEAFREAQRSILTGVMHPMVDAICDAAISSIEMRQGAKQIQERA